jgi:hypothetical protein
MPHTGASGTGHVLITQSGQVRMKPSGRWIRFTATEQLPVDRVAFRWRARFPILAPS